MVDRWFNIRELGRGHVGDSIHVRHAQHRQWLPIVGLKIFRPNSNVSWNTWHLPDDHHFRADGEATVMDDLEQRDRENYLLRMVISVFLPIQRRRQRERILELITKNAFSSF
jgi:hypothetical protein